MPFPRSTKRHRDAQRINAIAEIIAHAAKPFSPLAEVPSKTAQVITSGYSFFMAECKSEEKLLHGAQAALALGVMASTIAVSLLDESCCADAGIVCDVSLILGLAYQGVLLASWGVSEIYKEDARDNGRATTPEGHG